MTEHLPNSKISRTTPETQGKSHWEPAVGTLGELVADARRRAEKLREAGLASSEGASTSTRHSFREALRRNDVAIIAEVKRSSPSKGSINVLIDAAEQAAAYERGGAAAVSVLTEPRRFGGSIDDLAQVVSRITIPALKKDFHVDEIQLREAAATGVSAALIIVRAIAPSGLKVLAETARDANLEILYEIRDEIELARALDVGAEIIGVNNRNLETLVVDPTTVPRILPLIPRDCIAIAESGYSSREQIETAADSGADAVLIGSSLSASNDPEASVRELTGIQRRGR